MDQCLVKIPFQSHEFNAGSTDPASFGMYLVNEDVFPTQMLPLNDDGKNLPTSDKS